MKNLKKITATALGLMAPLIVFAQTVQGMVNALIAIARSVFTLLLIVGIVIFVYGIILYIYSAGDESKRSTAKNYIIYGLVGVFVMFGFWGIIELIRSTFQFNFGAPPPLPTLP